MKINTIALVVYLKQSIVHGQQLHQRAVSAFKHRKLVAANGEDDDTSRKSYADTPSQSETMSMKTAEIEIGSFGLEDPTLKSMGIIEDELEQKGFEVTPMDAKSSKKGGVISCSFTPEAGCLTQSVGNVTFFLDPTCFASAPCGMVLEDFESQLPGSFIGNDCPRTLSSTSYTGCFLNDELTDGWSYTHDKYSGWIIATCVGGQGVQCGTVPNDPSSSATWTFESDTISAVGFDVYSYGGSPLSFRVIAADDSVLAQHSLPPNGPFFGVISKPGVYIKKVVVDPNVGYAIIDNLRFGPAANSVTTVGQSSSLPQDDNGASGSIPSTIDQDSILWSEFSSLAQVVDVVKKEEGNMEATTTDITTPTFAQEEAPKDPQMED